MKIRFVIEKAVARVRRYISPVFVVLLIAAFILWYIAKLNYTYTTDFDVKINVDGHKFTVTCVAEGLGTNLLGYGIYTSRRINIPLSELQYASICEESVPVAESDPQEPCTIERISIEPTSLRDAISVRFSDIKIISVGKVPDIEVVQQ